MIIPCYKNCSPYELPRELAAFQALDMNKIGFLQDVVSGIKKIVNLEPQAEPKPGPESKIDRLCKNARTFYDLGQKEKAEQIYTELTDSYPDDYRGWWGFASVRTNQFQTYTREIFAAVKGNAENALKVAKGPEKEEIQRTWDQYLSLKNEKESARKRREDEALFQQYEQQLQQLKKKREAYEQTYKAEEGKLSGLYREQKERQEMIQNLQRDMNNHSRSTIVDKLKKVGIIIGIGVTVFFFAASFLPNVPYLEYIQAWNIVQWVIGSALLGALAGGIVWGIGSILGRTIATKDRIVQNSLARKYNTINAELQQINQEIGKIEPRKKANDATCASIDHLEKEMEALRHKLYSNTSNE